MELEDGECPRPGRLTVAPPKRLFTNQPFVFGRSATVQRYPDDPRQNPTHCGQCKRLDPIGILGPVNRLPTRFATQEFARP